MDDVCIESHLAEPKCYKGRRQLRRTKIIATIGPATDTLEGVCGLITAGVDVFRINFSHGLPEEHARRMELIRAAGRHTGCDVAVLGDLQGPKIRTDRFIDGAVTLNEGDPFILDAALDKNSGTRERVGITYKILPREVRPDDVLVLDDGRIVLRVASVQGEEVHTVVTTGGVLSNNKGINRLGGGLSAAALTEKDLTDIKLAVAIGVDYLAVSFPRDADDILLARRLLKEAGGDCGIIAKIERAEALDAIEAIMQASDAIMIARGDLGVEIGDAKLPDVQKNLIRLSRRLNIISITATQMMETMIKSPIPTRAEAFDVANAVLDGTDAVMLSGETAVGAYPVKVVQAMSEICIEAEKQRAVRRSDHRINTRFEEVDEAIAMAAMYVANHFDVKAIAAMTESGSTPRWMSRISSGIPIYAMTQHEKTRRKVKLYRGVYPVHYPTSEFDSHAKANKAAVEILERHGIVAHGDFVAITKGDLMGIGGHTNALKIVKVGDLPSPD
ncbi:MAG: pyruvate kinase [Thiotrichales bacterium]